MVNLLLMSMLILMFLRTFKVNIYKVLNDGYYLVYEVVLWNVPERRYYTETKKIKIYNLEDDGSSYTPF